MREYSESVEHVMLNIRVSQFNLVQTDGFLQNFLINLIRKFTSKIKELALAGISQEIAPGLL